MESLKIIDQTTGSGSPDRKMLYKVSGISAIILVISYLVIIALYIFAGAPPTGGEGWLQHISGHIAAWWSILGLSVFTDLLYIPVACALYVMLKEVNKTAMIAGAGLLILFVFLDLAVTWPNYSSLIILSTRYATTTDHAQREAIISLANYASVVLSSGLIGVYIILVPAIGIFMISLVMLKGTFSRASAWLGVATGIFGAISVVGPLFIKALGTTVVITSLLTTVWFLLVGYRLLRLSRSETVKEQTVTEREKMHLT